MVQVLRIGIVVRRRIGIGVGGAVWPTVAHIVQLCGGAVLAIVGAELDVGSMLLDDVVIVS